MFSLTSFFKDLQVKIIEQLRASGKSAGQIDLHNLFSEVFSRTMKRMNGLEITNCSLRISSNGKRKQSTESRDDSTSGVEIIHPPTTAKNSSNQTITKSNEEVPCKKPRKNFNNNTSSLQQQIQNTDKATNPINGFTNKSSLKRSENQLTNGNQGQVIGPANQTSASDLVSPTKRPKGRPRKLFAPLSLKPKTNIIPRPTPSRCSKRLHDHSIKEWPYQALPIRDDPKDDHCSSKKPLVPKKKKLRGPHRESTKVKTCRKLLFHHKSGKPYVSVKLFNYLFVNFKMDPGSLMSFIALLHGDLAQDFLFKKWQVTHMSLRAAQDIVNVMKKPLSLSRIFDQLQTLPNIHLPRVRPEDYQKTHLTQLSQNEFCNLFALGPAPTRVSMRTKQPTQKFQDSPCLTSMATLSSSITTPPKKSPVSAGAGSIRPCNLDAQFSGKGSKDKLLQNAAGNSWISGKLRPKFRQLLDKKVPRTKFTPAISDANDTKMAEDAGQQASTASETRKKVENDLSFLADVAADENEIVVLEDDMPEVIMPQQPLKQPLIHEVPKENGKQYPGDTNMIRPQLLPPNTAPRASTSVNSRSNRAVRKFPSYGWNREREARIKIDVNKKENPVIQVKKSLSRTLDFPPFQLSGLVETAPKEVEGWFTSKVSLLRQLSVDTSGSLRSSPNASRNGSSSSSKKATNKKSNKGRVPVKVFQDDQVETIVDLAEYKHNLEQLNSIIEEIETATSAMPPGGEPEPENNDQVINEALRVAKKIEKISIAGIGRQVSLPSPHSFLPPGWHCRQPEGGLRGWEYVNNDGYKVKSIQAAIKYEASLKKKNFTKKSSTRNTTAAKNSTKISHSELLNSTL